MLALTPALSPRRGRYIRSWLPFFAPGFITRDRRAFAMPRCARDGDVNFRALIGKGIVELAPKQHSEIVGREREREFRFACRLAAHARACRKNLLSVQPVHAPFVT